MVTSLATWNNSDGLLVKFGTSEAISMQQGGFVCSYGPYLQYFLGLDLTNLDQNETIQNDVLVIPKNSLIYSVETLAVTAAVTGTAIDVGLIANDRTTTTDLNGSITDADPDGLLAAFPIANMNATGEWNLYTAVNNIPSGATFQGALIGKILTVPTLITASQTDATSFTAGKILLKISVLPEATVGFGVAH